MKPSLPFLALALVMSAPAAQARDGYPANEAEMNAAVAALGETMSRADKLETQGRIVEAEPLWHDALAQRQRLLGDRDPLVAKGMDQLARNIEMQGDYRRAEALRRSALALREADAGSAADLPDACSALGYNLTRQGKLHEGAAQSYRALELLREAGKAENPEAAKALSVVGLTLDTQGKFAEAEPFYRRALDIRRKALGEDDLDTATSYNNLATALSGQGRYEDAEDLLLNAMTIRERNGTVPALEAESISNVAINLDRRKQHAKAAILHRMAINKWTQVFGANHVLTAAGYNGLGMSYFLQGQYSFAAVEFDRALELRKAALGRDNPEVAESYGNLGMAERAMGHEAAGMRLLRTALEIDLRTIGPDHPDTKAVRAAIDSPAPEPSEQPMIVTQSG
ncbi:tetratricopeptide repeat protein [Novosphingobium sp.]|jgi:tetratricopeptide (TPR) repeat protein|uniref:tetratricopeptide repeat protein n=1 Tax=Novosphingobium sp. TaxID=1874826 RepID=UPI002FE39CD6